MKRSERFFSERDEKEPGLSCYLGNGKCPLFISSETKTFLSPFYFVPFIVFISGVARLITQQIYTSVKWALAHGLIIKIMLNVVFLF